MPGVVEDEVEVLEELGEHAAMGVRLRPRLWRTAKRLQAEGTRRVSEGLCAGHPDSRLSFVVRLRADVVDVDEPDPASAGVKVLPWGSAVRVSTRDGEARPARSAHFMCRKASHAMSRKSC